jgi:proteasome accessory factor B
LWREAALGDSAQSGLRKLKSLGIDSDIDSISQISGGIHDTPEQLPDLIEALTERRRVSFEYLDEELASQVRIVEPYRLSNARGYWYLVGFDLDKKALRTFRLDRFSSSITIKGGSQAFEVDLEALDAIENIEADDLYLAKVAARKGKAPSLRSEARISDLDSEWDLLEIPYRNEQTLIREILWAGENAYIIEPVELRKRVVSILEQAVTLHG